MPRLPSPEAKQIGGVQARDLSAKMHQRERHAVGGEEKNGKGEQQMDQ